MHTFCGFQVGFGIYGAGCTLPSRFIEMYKYFPWIESTTGDMQSGKSYETKVFGDQNVPIHQMFRSGNNKFPPNNRLPPYFPEYYEFGFAPDISRINKTAIVICKLPSCLWNIKCGYDVERRLNVRTIINGERSTLAKLNGSNKRRSWWPLCDERTFDCLYNFLL